VCGVWFVGQDSSAAEMAGSPGPPALGESGGSCQVIRDGCGRFSCAFAFAAAWDGWCMHWTDWEKQARRQANRSPAVNVSTQHVSTPRALVAFDARGYDDGRRQRSPCKSETASSSAKTQSALTFHGAFGTLFAETVASAPHPTRFADGMNQPYPSSHQQALPPAAAVPQSQPRRRARQFSVQLWRAFTACIGCLCNARPLKIMSSAPGSGPFVSRLTNWEPWNAACELATHDPDWGGPTGAVTSASRCVRAVTRS
jgi:hypothetical protein